MNTITSLIASLQVNEAIKIILNKNPDENLLHINIDNNNLLKIKVKKDPNCPACNKNFEYLSGKKLAKSTQYCGSSYLIRVKFDFHEVKSKLKKHGIKDFGDAFLFDKITVFQNSVLIKAKSKEEAKGIYDRYIGN